MGMCQNLPKKNGINIQLYQPCSQVVIYIYTNWWFQPPWKIWKSDWMIIPTIGENKTCSKPPTSILYIYTTKKRHSNLWSPVFKFDPISPGYQVMRETQCHETLWLCQQFAIENGPVEIVDLPINSMGIFHNYVNVYQRVTIFNWGRLLGIPIFNGNFRILKWRYCTIYIYKAIFCGDIPIDICLGWFYYDPQSVG